MMVGVLVLVTCSGCDVWEFAAFKGVDDRGDAADYGSYA